MKEPVWLAKDLILAVHDELLSLYGGSAGVRDEGLLDSALGKPLNLFLYEKASLFKLAAAYAAGIVKNHPFIDGNKRTGFIAAYTFLGRNGYQLVAPEVDATLKTLGLASGELSQEQYAEWIEANSKRAAKRRKQ